MRRAARRRGLHAHPSCGRQGREVPPAARRSSTARASAAAARGCAARPREGVPRQPARLQVRLPDAAELGRRRPRDHLRGDVQAAARHEARAALLSTGRARPASLGAMLRPPARQPAVASRRVRGASELGLEVCCRWESRRRHRRRRALLVRHASGRRSPAPMPCPAVGPRARCGQHGVGRAGRTLDFEGRVRAVAGRIPSTAVVVEGVAELQTAARVIARFLGLLNAEVRHGLRDRLPGPAPQRGDAACSRPGLFGEHEVGSRPASATCSGASRRRSAGTRWGRPMAIDARARHGRRTDRPRVRPCGGSGAGSSATTSP